MGTGPTKPTRTASDTAEGIRGQRYDHDAYGRVEVMRAHGGSTHLFGSALTHHARRQLS
jgi:hypothetical protein